jgi:hypothetical protein
MENTKGEDEDVDGKIIFKWTIKTQHVRSWTGLNCLRMSSGGLLCAR